VRRPALGSAEKVVESHIPAIGKVADDQTQAPFEEPPDFFQEDDCRLDLADNTEDVGPDPALVLGLFALAGHAPRLARDARVEDINRFTPRFAVEGGDIRPDSERRYGALFSTRRQDCGRMGFSLNRNDCPVSGKGDSKSKADAIASGADGHSEYGRTIHTIYPYTSFGQPAPFGEPVPLRASRPSLVLGWPEPRSRHSHGRLIPSVCNQHFHEVKSGACSH
jgi:hypothetical protein